MRIEAKQSRRGLHSRVLDVQKRCVLVCRGLGASTFNEV